MGQILTVMYFSLFYNNFIEELLHVFISEIKEIISDQFYALEKIRS